MLDGCGILFNSEPGKGLTLTRSLASRREGIGIGLEGLGG